MSTHRFDHRRGGFTIWELLVIVVVVIVVIAFLLPTMNHTQNGGGRVRCAANLHNIGIAMQDYANRFNQQYPRTYYDPSIHTIDCSNFGGPKVPGSQPSESFGPLSVVPANSVTASIFLLAKTEELSPLIFVCPGSTASPGFESKRMADFANFDDGNPWGQTMTYSFNCMFPGPCAVASGWKWNSSISDPLNFAVAADMNPGVAGGPSDMLNNVTNVAHTSSQRDLRQGNSNNHNNTGQQVLYADGHVTFQTSPFCGSVVIVNSGFNTWINFNDNIYTARGVANTEAGTIGPTVFPLDAQDSYLLPTDDTNGF